MYALTILQFKVNGIKIINSFSCCHISDSKKSNCLGSSHWKCLNLFSEVNDSFLKIHWNYKNTKIYFNFLMNTNSSDMCILLKKVECAVVEIPLEL